MNEMTASEVIRRNEEWMNNPPEVLTDWVERIQREFLEPLIKQCQPTEKE
jgi:hypothetical protein